METDFQQLIDKHYGILYKITRAYTQTQPDFDDLYQEILIQLWKSLPRFKGQSKISTWMYRVALNTAMSFQKKQHRQQHYNYTAEAPSEVLSESPFEAAEQAQEAARKVNALYQAINQLKPNERALVLLHLEDKPYREIAEITGLSVNLVGVKLLRSKQKLHKILQKNTALWKN